MQVIVEQTAQRILPQRSGVFVRGQCRRELVQEIVELEALRDMLFNQIGRYQLVEQLGGVSERKPGQAGRCGQRQIRTRVQTEQAEQPGGLRGQGEI